MNTQKIYLMDNISSYLFNAFTANQNVIVTRAVDLYKITEGIILGDPPKVIANSNVLVFPLYQPKIERSNYFYNPNISALTMLLQKYIEPLKLDKAIPNYKLLKTLASLQDSIANKEYTSQLYMEYLKLTGYLHLYCFDTRESELIAYMLGKEKNIAVDNYVNYTNSYILKNINQAIIINSKEYGTIAVKNVDSNLQLIAKSLAVHNAVAVVHKEAFVMLCFNKAFKNKEKFIKLLVDDYEQQGCFITFYLRNVHTDSVATAISRLLGE